MVACKGMASVVLIAPAVQNLFKKNVGWAVSALQAVQVAGYTVQDIQHTLFAGASGGSF